MKPANKVCPRDFFNVSDGVCHLEPAQMEAFEASFRQWKDGAKRADSMLARQRLWLIFLMLRHTGARLGEILAIDDAGAFDRDGVLVRLGREDRIREVPLPEDVFNEIMAILESPMGIGLRGRFFQADPGYFRRTCYARGKDCGLPKELVGPNALRNTRAVEMLRNGVPITVVKDVLGQSSLDLTASFQQFSKQDVHSIVSSAYRSMRKQTSARNSFPGHVVKVTSDEVMAEVNMETRTGVTISSVITQDSLRNLNIVVGSPVVATVKAPLVNVLKGKELPIGSSRNRLRGKVLRVAHTPAICEVLGRLEDGTDVCALISAESAKELGLASGEEVEFRFKALSVVLNAVRM